MNHSTRMVSQFYIAHKYLLLFATFPLLCQCTSRKSRPNPVVGHLYWWSCPFGCPSSLSLVLSGLAQTPSLFSVDCFAPSGVCFVGEEGSHSHLQNQFRKLRKQVCVRNDFQRPHHLSLDSSRQEYSNAVLYDIIRPVTASPLPFAYLQPPSSEFSSFPEVCAPPSSTFSFPLLGVGQLHHPSLEATD